MFPILALVLAALAAPPQPAKHVIIVGIDGLRAAAIQESELPNIAALRKRGASTLHARGVLPTVSSPNWASMIMGANPTEHGITSNDWKPDKFEVPPVCTGSGGIFPTIFGVLREQRRDSVIGCFHDWKGFGQLLEPQAPDVLVRGEGPIATMSKAIEFLNTRKPNFLFIHLDHVDHAGHTKGYISPEYTASVIEADRLIGELVQALGKAKMLDQTVLLVTADHGGIKTGHGGVTLTELEIPWIIAGPGIAKIAELQTPVNAIDTAATAAYLLGVKPPACWRGKPVLEAVKVSR